MRSSNRSDRPNRTSVVGAASVRVAAVPVPSRSNETPDSTCHTPRPIFETGLGMNPIRRHYDLEEGNTCMTCHWKPEYDYGHFRGGAECN